MSPGPGRRDPALDALRALALLAVVVVNVAGYRSLPWGGPMPPLTADDAWPALGLSLLVATLLQGKGVALLTFLFGYSLSLARPAFARTRLERLLGLGLLHGFLVYCGDILSIYALAGLSALKHWRRRPSQLLKRLRLWALVGLALTLGVVLLIGGSAEVDAITSPPLTSEPDAMAWLSANALAYGTGLLVQCLIGMPLTFALVLAGRLRLLQHRRWRPLWQRLAAFAPWLLLLNGLYAVMLNIALATQQTESISLAAWVLGPLTMVSWLPWLLLRPLPDRLSRVGRNTLSLYLGSSLLAVLLWAPFALHLQTGMAAAYALAFAGYAALAAVAASRERLPLEAWMARRRPA